MYSLSAYTHLAEAILGIIVMGYFAISYIKTKHAGTKIYIYVFGSITLYTLSLSLPLFIWPENLEYAGLGFVFCTFFIGMALIATTFTLTFRHNISHTQRVILRWGIGIITAIFMSILMADPRLPLMPGPGAKILWNVNPFVSWGLGVHLFVWGMLWFYLSIKNSRLVEDKYSKAKAIMLGFTGFLVGVASPFYFPATSALSTNTASIIMLVNFTILGLFFWMIKILKRSEKGQE